MNIEEAMNVCRTAQDKYTLDDNNHAALYELLAKQSFPDGANIVELGCCYGRTSLILAYVAKHKNWDFHAVDCFILSPEADYRNVMNNSNLPYTLHVNWTSGCTVPQRADLYEIKWDSLVHFLFIDASHNEPWFSADCKKWLPWVAPGGIVAFDDWPAEEVTGAGAHDAIAIYGEQLTKDWVDLGWCGRVRIKQKPYETIDI